MKKIYHIIITTVVVMTTSGFSDTIITFDPPSIYGGSRHLDEYFEQGFHFITPNGMIHKHLSERDGINPYNGTAYLRFSSGLAPLTIREVNSNRFDLYSVDLAYYSIYYHYTTTIVGYRDGIECGRDIFRPSSSFRNFQLSDDFRDLEYLEITNTGYSIDNIHLQVIPEPTTLSLLALGVFFWRGEGEN